MLSINNLKFTYPHFKQPIIDDISLSIEKGNVYALLGPNGAGKSTLLYLIAGLLTPQSGNVELNGINTRLRLPQTLSDIFLVPEEFSLPSVTMKKYVELYSGFYPRFSIEDLERNLAMFELPAELHLGRLSMGQKKKAMMSFALAANTPLLIMDEPTNGLDIPGKANFRTFIASHMSEERTIIISTHQVADVNRLLDHVIIMDHNHILLNESTYNITEKLAFVTTNDPLLIENALLAKPAIMGTDVVLANTNDTESEINLEMLFELVTNKTEIINSIFRPTPPPYEK